MPSQRPELPAREQRLYAVRDLEVRATNDDGSIPMEGHAAVFNQEANIGGWFREQIAPGAFRKTIGEADVRLLINHDPNLVLARNRAGTLKLAEDEVGLHVGADMAPTSYGQDLALSMARGDVSQMSFAFSVVKEEWDESADIPLRTIKEARLYDVSVVTYPAYEGTDAALRSRQFAALLEAIGLDRLPDEERAAFLSDLISHEIDPSRLPLLRAARTALDELAARAEPHEKHSDEAAAIRIRQSFTARRSNQ